MIKTHQVMRCDYCDDITAIVANYIQRTGSEVLCVKCAGETKC